MMTLGELLRLTNEVKRAYNIHMAGGRTIVCSVCSLEFVESDFLPHCDKVGDEAHAVVAVMES